LQAHGYPDVRAIACMLEGMYASMYRWENVDIFQLNGHLSSIGDLFMVVMSLFT